MRKYFTVFFAIFIPLYLLANYYVGLKLWKVIVGNRYIDIIWPFWCLIAILAFSFFMGRLVGKRIPYIISVALSLIGGYWLGFLFYSVLLLGTWDLLVWISRYVPFTWVQSLVQYNAEKLIFIFNLGLLIYGTLNALNPVLKHYEVNIAKKSPYLNKLHIVMVSDLHLGNIVNKSRLKKLLDTMAGLNPQLVLFVGDTIDEDIEPIITQQMTQAFAKMKTQFGMYAVFGNHEYWGRRIDRFQNILQNAGITILRDEYVKIANSVYLIGREDPLKEKLDNVPRKSLQFLLQNIDQSLPIIVMDHTPADLKEARSCKIDLQLSGHTHRGQMYPLNYLTGQVFEIDWGYMNKDGLQVIVSCGYGTWGPPVRIGNKPEIIDLLVTFE